MTLTRTSLARLALEKSVEVREEAGYDDRGPICAYEVCKRLGVEVRFVDVSMEGTYLKSDPPQILLSALRPLPRRAFTCGHELGHHAFGHGSTIDELKEEAERGVFNPDEFLVDSFAGFLLMPKIAVRKAFALRGWERRRAKGDRNALYEEYVENLPTYVDMAPDKNRCGLYFSRLIAFGVDPRTGERLSEVQIGKLPGLGNQLEFLIQRCRKGVRKSLFQAAVFDPARDHVGGAQQGFPCMQHVTFVPEDDQKTLAVNAFYATQQLFVKAYGNYLGLARLGAFFADQAGLTLTKVSCFGGVEKMDQRPAAGPPLDVLITAAAAAVRGARAEADVAVEVVG